MLPFWISWVKTKFFLRLLLTEEHYISVSRAKNVVKLNVFLDSQPSIDMACTSGKGNLITAPNVNGKVFTVRSKLNFTMECFDETKMIADFQWVYQKGETSNISKVYHCSTCYSRLFQDALGKSCADILNEILED